jgi:hypothetical protein
MRALIWLRWLSNYSYLHISWRNRPTATPFLIVNDTRWTAIKILFRLHAIEAWRTRVALQGESET